MRNSLLGKTFFSLSNKDRKALRQVIHSESFNPRSEVVRLLDYLEQFAEQPSADKTYRRSTVPQVLSKEAAFEWVFAGKKTKTNRRNSPAGADYDDGKMRHLMTYTLEAIRLFLAWDDWKSNPGNIALHLCKALKKRGLESLFEKDYQRAISTLNAKTDRSAEHYFHHYSLESDAWQLYRAVQRHSENKLQTMADSFGVYVAINTLRQGCAALAQKTLAENQLKIPYLNETLNLVEQGFFTEIPAVQIYFYCYKTLIQPNDHQTFASIKKHLNQVSEIFPDDELRDIYVLAINFCIRQLNAGERQYIQEAFNLYRLGLARKVFLENASLSRFTYRNILNLSLALSEWEWSLEYLHEFAQYLPAKDRDNIFRYNLATYYFRRPDYDRALELLRQVEFRDVLYNFDARRMLLRIYYDRQEYQALESLLESFYLYVQRHPGAGYHREMYQNLVRFTKRLIKIKPNEPAEWNRLKTDIEQTKHLAERDWLLSQIKISH